MRPVLMAAFLIAVAAPADAADVAGRASVIDGDTIEIHGERIRLESAVESLCSGYLAFEHGGWENNDGAFGEFTIDVAARTIALEFSARFSTYDTTWHDF